MLGFCSILASVVVCEEAGGSVPSALFDSRDMPANQHHNDWNGATNAQKKLQSAQDF
jgi:hypothetical protein